MPPAVKNNSGQAAILDCNFSFRTDDADLELKWLLNDKIVYRWTPDRAPQVMGILKDRLDLQYKATEEPQSAYRAMKIINPTTDVSGEYKCVVSTSTDEDFSMRNMTVFGTSLTFSIFTK